MEVTEQRGCRNAGTEKTEQGENNQGDHVLLGLGICSMKIEFGNTWSKEDRF